MVNEPLWLSEVSPDMLGMLGMLVEPRLGGHSEVVIVGVSPA